MLPGPLILRECSGCEKNLAQETILSGNSFGARYWTDGKSDAPMLPDEPLLVKCPHCHSLVWIEELKEVGEIYPCDYYEHFEKKEFPGYMPAVTPTFEDYTNFLKTGTAETEKERYVCIRAWWAGNDERRNSRELKPLSHFETQNLHALIRLLNQDIVNERIMKAEAYRELGEFAEAEKLLEYGFDEEMMEVVDFIRGLIQKQVANVTEIVLP